MRRSVRTSAFAALGLAATMFGQDPPPPARWHHVHINSTNPAASIEFYTSKFDCGKGLYQGSTAAVWAQQSWLLFDKAGKPPASEILSPIWHIGWGAEDMQATYDKQVASGTKFQTPITDISELAGNPKNGFFYAYVDGPDHELIELNTANHHRFGHLHLLSLDPVAAGEWYAKNLGLPVRKQTQKREYRGFQVAPASFAQAGNVSIIIYPVEYARAQWPDQWATRKDFEPTRGRAIDHIAFSVDDLGATLTRLRAAGVKIAGDPHPTLGVMSAMIEGPDHIAIELVEGHAAKP